MDGSLGVVGTGVGVGTGTGDGIGEGLGAGEGICPVQAVVMRASKAKRVTAANILDLSM